MEPEKFRHNRDRQVNNRMSKQQESRYRLHDLSARHGREGSRFYDWLTCYVCVCKVYVLYKYQNTYMVDRSRLDGWTLAREENTPLGQSAPFYTRRTRIRIAAQRRLQCCTHPVGKSKIFPSQPSLQHPAAAPLCA